MNIDQMLAWVSEGQEPARTSNIIRAIYHHIARANSFYDAKKYLEAYCSALIGDLYEGCRKENPSIRLGPQVIFEIRLPKKLTKIMKAVIGDMQFPLEQDTRTWFDHNHEARKDITEKVIGQFRWVKL